MTSLRSSYARLPDSYIFRQVNDRAAAYASEHPDQTILKMGVGNTSLPLSPAVTAALHAAIDDLSEQSTYTGYGDELGSSSLRRDLADYYNRQYGTSFTEEEFTISDGTKSDSANIASIFEQPLTVAVQDPVYPVYVEANVLLGNSGELNGSHYEDIVYLPCTADNGFVPEPPTVPVDIIYLCSPNNPTGVVMTHEQLKRFVDYAIEHKAVIVFDAAYSQFVRDDTLPRSIYEVEGADKCSIEVNSFSKWAGFTGVRLAWTIVPTNLVLTDTKPGDVLRQWRRRQLAMFNGPSNIVQAGGRAVLSKNGLKESQELIDYYLENARIIKTTLSHLGFEVYGGDNSPYIWVKSPNGMTSWEFFDLLLDQTQVVTTPGVGFGPEGEGYIRLSALSSHEVTKQAMQRIEQTLGRQ